MQGIIRRLTYAMPVAMKPFNVPWPENSGIGLNLREFAMIPAKGASLDLD